MLPWAGKDITEAMADEDEHVHSKSAYEMMSEVRPPSFSAVRFRLSLPSLFPCV